MPSPFYETITGGRPYVSRDDRKRYATPEQLRLLHRKLDGYDRLAFESILTWLDEFVPNRKEVNDG